MTIRTLPTLLALLVLPVLSHAEDKYTSEEGKYMVTFPGKPTTSTKEVDTPVGKLTMNVASFEVAKSLGLITIYSDYPEAIAKDKPQSVLARVRDGSKGSEGKLLEDKEIDLDGVPGREYLVAKGDDHFYRARIFLVGPRLYQVIVSASKKDEANLPGATAFLDSFKIAK